MCLAEAEGGERLEHLPHLVHHRPRIAAGAGPGQEPGTGLGHPLDVAESAPLLVGLGQRDVREAGDDLDHLLVEDHHPVGGSQDRGQVGVEVGSLLPALLHLQVRRDHVALDRPRAEERDVGDDLLEGVDARLADELALPRRLDLEDPQGPGRADQVVGRPVVEGHLRLVVEIHLDLVETGDLVDGVRHGRLHPDAQHVELEQAEVLHVVLVELAHREPGVARLDRCPVEQRHVGEQHSAGMDRDVARQSVEAFDETEHQVQSLLPQPAGPQLRQVTQRHPGVPGADMGKCLGDRVDLARRHAQRGTDVADRVAHPIGLHHRHAHAALPAVAVEDRPVDLEASGRLHVDVDVGQRLSQRGEEAFHQQVVAQRVDAGDAQEVVDQAPGPGPPGRAPHPHLADQVGDVADGEEVGGIAQGPDDCELVVETLPDPLPRRVAVAGADGSLAPGPQEGIGSRRACLPGGATSRLQLREVDLADPQVGPGVQGAPLCHLAGHRQQLIGLPRAEPGEPADLLGDLGHLPARLQEALGVVTVHVTTVQGDQPPGGVEDVDCRGIQPVGVAHRVGEHRPETEVAGSGRHPGRVRSAARPPPVRAAAHPVRDQLDEEALARHAGQPGVHHRPRQVLTAPGQGSSERGRRSQQHHHVAAHQIGRQQLQGRHRPSPLAGEVDRRDQPAHLRPPGPPLGQQRDPGQPVLTERSPAHRASARRHRPRPPPGSGTHLARGVHGEVHPQDRTDPGPAAGLGELHRPVGAVPVGERQQVHPVLGCTLHQGIRVRGAVLEGVARRHVEMGEGIRRHRSNHPVPSRPRASAAPRRCAARAPDRTPRHPGSGRRPGPGHRPPAR